MLGIFFTTLLRFRVISRMIFPLYIQRNMQNIILFYGEDQFKAEQELMRWQSNFSSKYGSENIEKPIETSLTELLNNAQQTSIFSEKRLIIVSGLLSKSNETEVQNFLANLNTIPENTIIIFIEQKKFDERKKVSKELLKNLTVKKFPLPTKQTLDHWIIDHAKANNKELSAKLIKFFHSEFSDHPELLNQELLKIYQFAGPENTFIDLELVANLISKPGHTNAFALTDLIGSKNPVKIKLTINELNQQGEDFTRLFYLIANHLRNLKITQTCHGNFSEFPELKLHPFVQQKLKIQAKSINHNQLNKILQEALRIDHGIKTGIYHTKELPSLIEKILTFVN